jgi:hypothetical protein
MGPSAYRSAALLRTAISNRQDFALLPALLLKNETDNRIDAFAT